MGMVDQRQAPAALSPCNGPGTHCELVYTSSLLQAFSQRHGVKT